MFRFFDVLDRACDTLAHAFDREGAPDGPRSHPQTILFLLALVLVPCALVLSWEWSPWLLAVLGLIVALVSAALYVVWAR